MGISRSRAKSRRAPCFGVSVLGVWDDLRGARQLGAEHRATYLYSVDPRDLDHDAVIRIGGRAPERWAHSTRRPESHSWVRVTTTSDRHRMPAEFCAAAARKRCLSRRLQAGRILTPTNVSPVVTSSPNAIIRSAACAPWRRSAGESSAASARTQC